MEDSRIKKVIDMMHKIFDEKVVNSDHCPIQYDYQARVSAYMLEMEEEKNLEKDEKTLEKVE